MRGPSSSTTVYLSSPKMPPAALMHPHALLINGSAKIISVQQIRTQKNLKTLLLKWLPEPLILSSLQINLKFSQLPLPFDRMPLHALLASLRAPNKKGLNLFSLKSDISKMCILNIRQRTIFRIYRRVYGEREITVKKHDLENWQRYLSNTGWTRK